MVCYMLMVSCASVRVPIESDERGAALVTGQLSKEIKDIGKEIESLFGVLDEDMFKLQ